MIPLEIIYIAIALAVGAIIREITFRDEDD